MAMLKSCLLLFIIFSMGNAEGNQYIYFVKTLAIYIPLTSICMINKGFTMYEYSKYINFQHIITKT